MYGKTVLHIYCVHDGSEACRQRLVRVGRGSGIHHTLKPMTPIS